MAVVLLLGAAMAVTALVTPALRLSLPGTRILAAALAGAGVMVALLGVASFRRARTTVNPLRPAATSRLVVSGIYRYTRNPMYLGMLLTLLGWGVWLAHVPALAVAAAFVPLMNRLQIGPEERTLAVIFGPEFITYQSTVRRWL